MNLIAFVLIFVGNLCLIYSPNDTSFILGVVGLTFSVYFFSDFLVKNYSDKFRYSFYETLDNLDKFTEEHKNGEK